MAQVADELDKAHKSAAVASGLLVAMIARRRFNRAHATAALQNLEIATRVVKKLLGDISADE